MKKLLKLIESLTLRNSDRFESVLWALYIALMVATALVAIFVLVGSALTLIGMI